MQPGRDEQFIALIESLSFELEETYYYIEAQRSYQLLKDLSSRPEAIDMDNLEEAMQMNLLPAGYNSEYAVKSLTNFWMLFGKLPKPSDYLKEELIRRYEKFLGPLADNEIEFFRQC